MGMGTSVATGTGGQGGAGPPIFYSRDFINIHAAAQIATIAVYITFGPPKMELLPTPMVACHFSCETLRCGK